MHAPAEGNSDLFGYRQIPASLPKINGVEFDAYLTCNGSLCYSGQEVIFSDPIPRADVRRVIRNAAELGRPVSVATRERLAANGTDVDLADYYSFANLELTVAEDFSEVSRQDVYQVMLGCREKDYPSILKGVSGARITASWDRAADVIPVNSGKGTGIQLVIASGPFKGGKVVEELVSTESLPKTFLTLAGVDVGDKMIGENLVDISEKKYDESRPNEVFTQISESRVGRCVRTADFTYSVYAPGVHGGVAAASDVYADDFLYDMRVDPHQLNNVVADPAYAEIKADMRKRLLKWLEKAEGAHPTIID